MNYKKRYRRNLIVLLLIIVTSLLVLIYNYISEVNGVYQFEDMNHYVWQKYMNEEEFEELSKGMSYMDVVSVAKGSGEEISENVFVWQDELLLTQVYELHFKNDQLINKKIIEKRGYSTRGQYDYLDE